MLRVVAHELVNLGVGLGASVSDLHRVDHQSRYPSERVQEGGSGGGKRHCSGVMRDTGPEPDCWPTDFGKRPFDCGLNATGNIHRGFEVAHFVGQRLGRRRGAYGDGSGMRCGGGECPESDAQSNVELLDDFHKCADECIPSHIRLGSGQNEEILPGRVPTMAKLQTGPREFGVHAIDEAHRWPTSTLVKQFVGLEAKEALRANLVLQRAHRRGRRISRFDPSLQRHHQHGVLETRRNRIFPNHQLTHTNPSRVSAAVCASRGTCISNAFQS